MFSFGSKTTKSARGTIPTTENYPSKLISGNTAPHFEKISKLYNSSWLMFCTDAFASVRDQKRQFTLARATLLILPAIASTLGAVLAVSGSATDPSRLAVFFPPWWNQARSFAAAASAGEILGLGGAPFVVIMHGDPAHLAQRARSAGAILLLSANPASYCSHGHP